MTMVTEKGMVGEKPITVNKSLKLNLILLMTLLRYLLTFNISVPFCSVAYIHINLSTTFWGATMNEAKYFILIQSSVLQKQSHRTYYVLHVEIEILRYLHKP